MTTRHQAKLKGWIETGTNTFMPRTSFLKYTNDSELKADEKQNILNSGDRHATVYEDLKERRRELYSRPRTGSQQTQQQPQTAAPRDWSEEEVKGLNPVFIDERLEAIKHLHPKELNSKRDQAWE